MVNRHLLCSTPVGVIEKNTPWTSPARIFWLMCSTPVGVIEKNTYLHYGPYTAMQMCSTPVGVIEKNTPAAWFQPSFEINCAQRLSASSRKTPDTGLDLCVASVLCSTPVGVIEKN